MICSRHSSEELRSSMICRLDKPCQSVFAQLLQLLHASILIKKAHYFKFLDSYRLSAILSIPGCAAKSY